MPVPLDKIVAHMGDDVTPLELILRAHLWTEAMLNRVIQSRLVNPGALRVDRTSFAAKVDLAHALGAIEQTNVAWFRSLNKLRNRLAHELDGEPTISELVELADGARGPILDVAQGVMAVLGDRIGRDKLRVVVLCQLLMLEYSAQHETWRRSNQDALTAYRVKRAMLRIGGEEISAERDAALRAEHGIAAEPRPGDATDPPLRTMLEQRPEYQILLDRLSEAAG
ncbi:MAG TPA: hypothetical protein VGE38_03490 [Nocardioides sp.]|uniref:hypothetical protein n=1 Tax=Nocardioides sp. TaxID=35761 RepID=UPI002ED900FF